MNEQTKIQTQLKKLVYELNVYENMINDFINSGESELASYKKIYVRLFDDISAKLTSLEKTTNQLTEGK